MKKEKITFLFITAAFLVLFFSLTAGSLSQPQYFNLSGGTLNNAFPFNTLPASGKTTQTLYLPGSFNQPGPAPGGNITKIYFQAVSSVSVTYTQLTIKMGLTTDTDLPTGAWYTGPLTTVLDQSNFAMTTTADQFAGITLTTPFNYDPAKSLVVEITQCGYTGTGFGVRNTTTSGVKRHAGPLTAAPCPHVWGNSSAIITHTGLDIAPPLNGPDYLFYKFENNPAPLSVLNCAIPGVGTSPASMTGLTLTSGGQFDSCITGTGVTSAGIVTGWNNNLGASSWTISMWIDCNTTTFGYLFGDGGGSFRCFNNGAAGTGAITLRGTGITNVDVPAVNAGPVVIHFVYDSAAANIKVYKNGVLSSTVPQTPLNLTAGTGFKVGGYTTVAGFTGKMDEFRLYRRALDSTEIQATWNQDIPCGTLVSVPNTNNQVPKEYVLQQNYPNPFNPTTNITFALPKSGVVVLKVYDVLGKEVASLVNSFTNAGTHIVPFDASALSSGVYIYKITTGEFTDSKKMVLIK